MGWLYQNGCLFCSKEIAKDQAICKHCATKYPAISEGACKKCGQERCRCALGGFHSSDVSGITACYEYQGEAEKAIKRLKFYDSRYLARTMSLLMSQRISQVFGNTSFDLIIPIPMQRMKLWQRGYNQASSLAKYISRFTNIPCYDKILKKVAHTKAQHTLDQQNRQVNLKNAYCVVRPDLMYEKTILLVDDVITTGATVRECAKELIACGAKEVYAVGFCLTARGIHRGKG